MTKKLYENRTTIFLNNKLKKGAGFVCALQALKESYGVSYSQEYGKGLYVLNYSQIDSPKHNRIADECRSLVIYYDSAENLFKVESRSFDRFYNYGDMKTPLNITKMRAYEKVDGSICMVWYSKSQGKFLYRTRSMIMPDVSILMQTTEGYYEVYWKTIIESALDWDNVVKKLNKDSDITYIFEIVSPYNKVVVYYPEIGSVLLSARLASTGEYVNREFLTLTTFTHSRLPKAYYFSDWELCLNAAKELRNTEEGYVMYSPKGVPVLKVKNPAYVAAHHLRGEGLTWKRIIDLILINEVDEYLSVFPEDAKVFQQWDGVLEYTEKSIKKLFDENYTTDKKEFASKIKDVYYLSKRILFSLYNGVSYKEAFDFLWECKQKELLLHYKNAMEEEKSV